MVAEPQSLSSLTKLDSFVDADDGLSHEEDDESTWKPSIREGPNPMTEKYLSEQNEEFNSLINRNLKEVIQQQDSFTEEIGWQRLLIELAMARNSDDLTLKINLLMNKLSDTAYSYIPFIQGEPSRQIPTLIGVPGGRIEALDVLDEMDYDTKVLFLKLLVVDLGLSQNTHDLAEYARNLSLTNEATMIDKFELLCLLSIRLSFICLKSVYPICKLLYEKFKEDEILLVNSKNFSKVLSLLIRIMEGFEKKMAASSNKQRATHV